jgi:hypothetical protein
VVRKTTSYYRKTLHMLPSVMDHLEGPHWMSVCHAASECKGGYTLVTLPRIVTPYRDSVDRTRDRVTYQKLVTR